jgi:phosphopantothenoylcysteine decarboxylase / phosphopantothenate---cysteine ligase
VSVLAKPRPGRCSIVITAGPTREKIDPIRFISNYSTGIFGYEIAKEAARRGCKVTLVSGPTCLESPAGIRTVRVESAVEMGKAVRRALKGACCLVMAAAVSDWRVKRVSDKKLKRGSGKAALELVENQDILATIGNDRKKGLFLAGFALETEAVEKNAMKKLRAKKLDMIIANAVGKKMSPFGDNNINITILDRLDRKTVVRGATKRQAAKIILDKAFSFNI